jgi:hypothetical protein
MFCGTSALADPAVTVRSTELKAQPMSDAATIATLPEKTKIETLKRQGAWIQVKSIEGKTGWVRMLSVRLGDSEAPKSDGLGGLLSKRNASSSGTVTTGVRGLSEEEITATHPNPSEVEKMESFTVNKSQGQKFAASGKLKSQNVDYLVSPKSTNNQTDSSWKKED